MSHYVHTKLYILILLDICRTQNILGWTLSPASLQGASSVLMLWKLLLAQDGSVLLPYVIGGDVLSVGCWLSEHSSLEYQGSMCANAARTLPVDVSGI